MKLGLVLEGGASRAYFSAGVMDFFLEKDIYADYVVGVSAGIANAASYVSKQLGRNIEIGEKYLNDERYMGMKHLLNPKEKSYYNVDFVFGEIPEKIVPFDYEAFKNAKCETVAGVTNVETGKTEYLTVNSADENWDALIATCALPIMFQPVKINGNTYLDGGIGVAIPVQKAIDEECDKIIVITTRERDYVKTEEKGIGLSSFVYRKYPEFVALLKNRIENYNICKKRVNELEDEGRIFQICPRDTSNWGRTDSSPEKIRAIYDLGYQTAERLYPELLKYLEK